MADRKKKQRLILPREKEIARPEEAALDAFDQLNKTTVAGFESESELPRVTGAASKIPIPLYGYYGDAFFGAVPSAELLEKEQKRFFKREDSYDDEIEILEKGLCEKYGITPPTKWPNRRKDRGTGGEQLLILGQTVNDRRHPKLWGIRQEDRTRHAYLLGPSGSGKSLPKSTKVLTLDKASSEPVFVRNGELKIGDLVYTKSGNVAPIIGIYEHPSMDIWEIELKDGRVIECSGDHNWIVKFKSHGRYVEATMTTKEIYDAQPVHQNGKNGGNSYRYSIPLCNPMNFPQIELPVPPYVLGILLGDGYISPNYEHLQISTADQEILNNCLAVLPEKYHFKKHSKNPKHYSWNIRILDENGYHMPKELKNILDEMGLNVLAHEKSIPDIYKYASIEQRRALLKGLMDSDGSASKGRFNFHTTSKHLYEDTLELIRSLGYMATTYIDTHKEYVNAECCYVIHIHSNDYENLFGLSRKKQDYLNYADNRSDVKEVYEHRDPETIEDSYSKDDISIDPYVLGTIFRYTMDKTGISTNGAVSDEIKTEIAKIHSEIEFQYSEYESGTNQYRPYWDIGKYKNGKHKNHILLTCRELGLIGLRKDRRIPEYILKGDVDVRQSFLQGLLDQYGTFENRMVVYTTVSEGHKNDYVALAESLGYDVSVNYYKSNKLYSIRIGIADNTMFRIPSKKATAEKLAARNSAEREEFCDSISIVDIRKTDRKCDMRCIYVDDPTHSYIIEGYIVTHNSTLLHAIGVEDMWYWRGGLLMEPHGDLALGLLRCAPPYRLHDIIYLDVLDPLASPGFNPLELPLDATDEMRQEATGTVTTLIAKHFNMDATHMPRLSKMLTNALNALSYVPGATILEIMDFYVNEDIRNAILSFVPDGPQKDAMTDLANNAKAEDLATLENRISRFTTNRFMRHLFGQSHTTMNFYKLMNEGKYIICPASKGGTSDDTFLKFYGSYIVSEVYKAAVMREAIEEGERVNFALTLDEFQNFMGDDIEGILAEARKYGLMMMLANQYLDQLTPPIRAAVLQNCATKLSYNLSPTDAKPMAQTFGNGLRPEDMQSIPKYHVMAAPLVNGGNLRPFISAVFPPISLKSEVSGITANLIREISRDKYMKPRDEIDIEITDRKERLASGNKEAIRELMTKKNR